MATRIERVVLELESNLTTGLARDAAAVALLKRELGGLDGSARKSSASIKGLDRDTERLSSRAVAGSRSIDKFSGRLGLLVDTATALGPALVPIGAVGIGAVAGLASELGFAAVGAGALALAFHNISTTLTAVNRAALVPTAANIQAAHVAMAQLPPEARSFVRELQSLRPELTRFQQAAGADLFPGLTAGLHSIRSDGPLVERALHNIGGEFGNLARDAGKSLSSDEWRPFLRFVGTEAPTQLGILGHSAGDVTHGLAELWMAFSPLNADFGDGILALAHDFDRWATSLDKTKDFQSFVAYIRTNEPRVVQLLGDTAQLFINVVKAAAPLGGPTLQALDLIVRALDAIANSPLGTPLLALGQINAILKLTSRGLGAIGVDAKVGLGGVTSGSREGSAALKALKADAISAGSAVRTIGGNIGKNAAGGTPLLAGVNREGLNNLAKAAGLVGGLTLAMSGLDQQMGLTNTTTLALTGSMLFPGVGTALGGTVGAMLDLQAQIDKDRASMEAFNAQVQALAGQGDAPGLQKLSGQLHTFSDQAGGIVGDLADKMSADVDPALDQTRAHLAKLSGSQRLAVEAAGKFGHAQQVAARETIAIRQAAQATSSKFRTLGADVNNAKVSLDQWVHQLAAQARALEQFGQNAETAADKGLRKGLIQELQKLGPEGALRLKQLANASQGEIGKANHAWAQGRQAALDYQGAVAYVNHHPANIYVNGVPQSIRAIRSVQSELAGLRDHTIHVTTIRTTGGHSVAGYASGGTIPGTRAPYGDRVLTMLAPGEEVISNRFGQADEHRALLKAINARRYADGGTVAASRVSVNVAGVSMARGGGGSIDYGQLATAMAAMRPAPPLYGDVYVTDGYGGFKRHMEQDRAMAALSGVRR